MKPKSATAILALAAALMAAPAFAQSGPQSDGAATRPALPAFAEIDGDANGTVTLDEWRAFHTARAETRRAERIEARVSALFEAADADGDGAITREELAAGLQSLDESRREQAAERRGERAEGGERRAERGDRGGRAHGAHRQQGPRGHRAGGFGSAFGADGDQWLVRSFQMIDRDGDGQITEEEYTRVQERFQRRVEGRRAPRRAD